MKKVAFPSLATIVIFSFALIACGGSHYGNIENMPEKMGIYSLITFTVFTIFLVLFGGSKQRQNRSSGKADRIQNGASYPLSATDIISYPVYIWDYRSSFHKIVFFPDGMFFMSSSVMANGLDPAVKAAGTWALTPEGKLVVTPSSAGTTRTYTRLSQNTSTVLMQPDLGLVEAWYFGSHSLANIQISIFGYSASVPATMQFTTALVSGKTFRWATYPCILVMTSGDVAVNHETTYGIITFNEDGTLTKSIENKIGFTPNYAPSIMGIWKADDRFGVLTMTVSGLTITASILAWEPENCAYIVSTATGNRIWLPVPMNSLEKLTAYITEACKFIPNY